MDPNATLAVMLDRARVIREAAETCGLDDLSDLQDEMIELAEAVENLNEWLSKGGFLPTQWTEARR